MQKISLNGEPQRKIGSAYLRKSAEPDILVRKCLLSFACLSERDPIRSPWVARTLRKNRVRKLARALAVGTDQRPSLSPPILCQQAAQLLTCKHPQSQFTRAIDLQPGLQFTPTSTLQSRTSTLPSHMTASRTATHAGSWYSDDSQFLS